MDIRAHYCEEIRDLCITFLTWFELDRLKASEHEMYGTLAYYEETWFIHDTIENIIYNIQVARSGLSFESCVPLATHRIEIMV